jgi:hypothetical protein
VVPLGILRGKHETVTVQYAGTLFHERPFATDWSGSGLASSAATLTVWILEPAQGRIRRARNRLTNS